MNIIPSRTLFFHLACLSPAQSAFTFLEIIPVGVRYHGYPLEYTAPEGPDISCWSEGLEGRV